MVVVANGPWPKHVNPARVSELVAGETLCPENDNRMTAKAVLICRPNSHPFQERSLTLDQPVKIGRSVARARPAPNNAIFDCKVLSRNHALLWYENGKFYLQDTKSSNGTFVNNQRLSKGSEESPPREVCSADIVQFGVDVMENSRKVTHGCIVATLKLYLPDGKEAKASPSTSVMSSVGMVPLEDLYQLNQYLQEALQREQLLENKLATLQRLVGSMRQASDEGWKALIDEDRLLSRVEILENQLQAYSKNFADDKLREELRKLMDDKEQYQSAAKESVHKVLQEKLDAIQKLQDLERALSNSEDECNVLRYLCEKSQGDTKDLAQKYKIQQQEVEELTAKIDENEKEETDFFLRLDMERQELQGKLKQLLEAGHSIPELGDSIPPKQSDDDLQQRLNAVQVHLHELQNKNLHSKLNELNDVKESDNKDDFIAKNNDDAPENMKEGLKFSHEEVDKLKHRLELTLEEQRDAYGLIEILQRQLEEFTLQQELKNNTANHLQERITNLEFQLEDAQDKEAMDEEVQSNKAPIIDGDKTDSASKIRAELVELEELLEEARTGKQTAEEQVQQARSQLKEVQSKSEKAAEEVSTIRQQLQQIACMDRGNRYSMLHLEQQMVNLVSTTQNMEAQMNQLQNRLQEEHQDNKKQADEIENLRKQLVDSQQNAKQCKNEAEKMKDTVRSLKKDLESKRVQTGSVVLEDIRKEEELTRCRQECESLQSWISVMENEMRTLKSDHSKLEEENRTLRNVKVDYEALKSKVREDSLDNSTHSEVNDESKTQSPTTPHDIIQLKQLYVSCQQRKAELAKDLENLQQENKRLSNQSNAVPLQLFFLFALLGAVFAWIFFIFYHTP